MRTKLLFISFFLLFAYGFILAQDLPVSISKATHDPFILTDSKILSRSINNRITNAPSTVIYDSIYLLAADSTKKWTPTDKIVDMKYNSNKDILSMTIKKFENQTWVNSYQYICNFDSNNKLISRLTQNWNNNNGWANSALTTCNYSATQREDVYQKWFGNSWGNFDRVLTTYDSNGNPSVQERQNWNGLAWISATRTIYSFNGTNKLQKLVQEMYTNSAWILLNIFVYQYDSNSNLVLEENYGGDTVKVDSIIQVFDANNKFNVRHYFQRASIHDNWSEISTSHFTYDSNGNLIHGEDEDFSFPKPYISFSFSYCYNMLNQTTDEVNLLWRYPGTFIALGDSSHYFIHENNIGINEAKPKNSILIYPNPSNGNFTINLENKRPIQNLEVYNVVGERIFQQHQSNQVSIPNAQTGIYFVKIDDGLDIYTKKITVH